MTDYELIKSHGYRIDTRGARFTLIKNVTAMSFDTVEEAIEAALKLIGEPK